MLNISREELPVFPFREQLLESIAAHPTLVIVGETGSGKTTQIPQFLFHEIGKTPNSSEKSETNTEPETQSPSKESESISNDSPKASQDKTTNGSLCNLRISNICVTQPRRIAAISVCKRVCLETGVTLGEEIGYTIRFEDRCGPRTRLRYVTDGILLRELCSDPLLTQYDCVIIDEAHERTLDTDIIIGLAKIAQKTRASEKSNIGPLRIIIMSATLNVEKFSDFFDNCPIFTIPGRMFDVAVHHHAQDSLEKLRSCYIDRAVETALEVHLDSESGDMLVFLTGQQEIHRAIYQFQDRLDEIISERRSSGLELPPKVTVIPIYAALENFDQRLAFELPPPGHRKIVFATNIAQTSITIPGIVYVIDCGFVKQKTFEPKTGMDALLVMPISQAAAIQRSGRAGRTQNGTVYRLYSRSAFESMESETTPEIQRSSLLSSILTMKTIGIVDVANFSFLDSPSLFHVQTALKKLTLLGAIHQDKITPLGSQMARLPLPPYLSSVLIHSCSPEFSCSRQVAIIAAMLSIEDPIIQPRNEDAQSRQRKIFGALFSDLTGDHLTLYNIFVEAERNGFDRDWCNQHYLQYRHLKRALDVRDQLVDLLNHLKLPLVSLPRLRHSGKPSQRIDSVPILKALCQGYFLNLARRHPQGRAFYHYHASSQDFNNIDHGSLLALNLHPTSVLNPRNHISLLKSFTDTDWIVYSQMLYTAQCQLRHVSAVDPNWALPLLVKSVKENQPAVTKSIPKVVSEDRKSQVDAARQRYLDRQKRSKLR